MKPKLRNNLIIVAVGGLVVFGCCGSLIFAGRQQVGVRVSRSDCPAQHRIPPNATNINYTYIAWGPSIQLEYDIAEPDFLAWTKSEGWSLTQKQDVYVSRPSAFTGGAATSVLVQDAYHYSHDYPGDDGAGYSVIYDRTHHRAYYTETGH